VPVAFLIMVLCKALNILPSDVLNYSQSTRATKHVGIILSGTFQAVDYIKFRNVSKINNDIWYWIQTHIAGRDRVPWSPVE